MRVSTCAASGATLAFAVHGVGAADRQPAAPATCPSSSVGIGCRRIYAGANPDSVSNADVRLEGEHRTTEAIDETPPCRAETVLAASISTVPRLDSARDTVDDVWRSGAVRSAHAPRMPAAVVRPGKPPGSTRRVRGPNIDRRQLRREPEPAQAALDSTSHRRSGTRRRLSRMRRIWTRPRQQSGYGDPTCRLPSQSVSATMTLRRALYPQEARYALVVARACIARDEVVRPRRSLGRANRGAGSRVERSGRRPRRSIACLVQRYWRVPRAGLAVGSSRARRLGETASPIGVFERTPVLGCRGALTGSARRCPIGQRSAPPGSNIARATSSRSRRLPRRQPHRAGAAPTSLIGAHRSSGSSCSRLEPSRSSATTPS